MIIALSGRRIDAVGAEQPRFPLQNIDLARKRIRGMFEAQRATVLVSSAACGADLIALSAAGSLGLRRRVVLPFDVERFRKTSVIDRPGDWGPLYDSVMEELRASGDLVVMNETSDEAAYALANHAILDEAVSLAKKLDQPVGAALVWDGISRGSDDVTEQFGVEAKKRGLPVIQIATV
jgi:hypothetical protein